MLRLFLRVMAAPPIFTPNLGGKKPAAITRVHTVLIKKILQVPFSLRALIICLKLAK